METTIVDERPSIKGKIPEPKSFSEQRREQIEDNKTRPLMTEDSWPINGEDIDSYESDFRYVLGGTHIVDIVKGKSFPVFVDIMGPSDTLADLSRQIPNKPKFGLAVSYVDKRSDQKKIEDEKLGIKQIAGDIMRAETWEKINKELDGKKADLVIERAVMGIEYIPKNAKLYAFLINKAYELLSDNGGVLLVQTPGEESLTKSGVDIERWVEYLNKNNINAVCKLDERRADLPYKWRVLKIVKTPDSPKNLPFLPSKI